jgi:hypothetical protein
MVSLKQHNSFESMVRKFSSNDGYRDAISKPICYQNGWVASTNSHKLLWFNDPEFINKENILDYEKGQGANAFSILEKYSEIYEGNQQPIGRVKFEDLRGVFLNIRKEPEYKEKYKDCSNCDGFGTVECDCCGHENKCDECDGEGNIICGKEETGHYRYPQGQYIKIVNNYFSLKEFEEILEYLSMVGVDELDVYFTNDNMKSFYGIPNERIFILLMGVHTSSNDLEKEYPINIL